MGKSILIVDDDELIRSFLFTILREEGHRVEEAGNGKEGLSRVAEGDFDLVITDLHVEEILKNMTDENKIPWNILFRRLCQWASLREKAYTKKRRSRRYGTRPGPYMKRRLKLTVAFDTSGSISDEDLVWFFSELDHIQRTGAEITLIQCDCSIQKVETYKKSFKRENHVYGRGGTAFTPVFEYLLEEKSRVPDLLVFFTDGYGDNPKDPKRFPVCWIYTPNHQKAADFGFHIEYEPRQT